jgi:outer membrane usher protein FimD/PapC
LLLCGNGAQERVEFNTDVLDASDRTRIDLSRFATDNYVTPGDYLLDIRINGQSIGGENPLCGIA